MLSLNHEQQEPKVGTTPVSQMFKIRHSMTEGCQLFSFKTIFCRKFSFQVEEMCLQHLPTLSLNGNEADGLQIEENLAKSKRHFFAL